MCVSKTQLICLTAALAVGAGCRQVLGIDEVVRTSWSEATPDAESPSPRNSHALSYDAARQRVVLFGGRSEDDDELQDTWEWDGASWSEAATSAGAPPARRAHALAYDAAREQVVLFGGLGEGDDELSDTWTWDGAAWTDVTPDEGSPAARQGHALAYDAVRERVVLFGGIAEPLNFFGDTWTWDGETWEEVTPPSGSPEARESHALTYDDLRERVVLFGGSDEPLNLLNDTWEWDGSEWSQIEPAGQSPEARGLHALTYDPTRSRVVLFGGLPDDLLLRRLDDTWEWDGAAWTESEPDLAAPAARSGHALAYEGASRRVLLFGGYDGSDRFADTWLEGPPLGE